MLAQEWFYGFMTCHDLNIKVERQLHATRILGRLVGCCGQWHTFSTDCSGNGDVGVRGTEQSVRHLLTPTPL